MAPRRSLFVRQARSKRLTDWGFGPDFLNATIAASGKLLGTTSLAVDDQETLIRVRGMAHIFLELAGVGAGFLGALGIGIVGTDAFTAGIASLPGPQTDAHWDGWLWHTFFDVRTITATLADGGNSQTQSVRIPIDSKAMRKWDPADTLVIMLEVVETGASSLRINADTRLLLKHG